jgi:hypothetical protein
MKVLPECLVLDVVPADPHTEAQAASGKEINVGCLPRDERRRALWKDQDSRRETDSLGDAGQIGEHHEWVMERIALCVGPSELGRSTGVDRAEYMVVREKVVKSQLLDRSANSSYCAGISSQLDLWIHDADLHRVSVSHG